MGGADIAVSAHSRYQEAPYLRPRYNGFMDFQSQADAALTGSSAMGGTIDALIEELDALYRANQPA